MSNGDRDIGPLQFRDQHAPRPALACKETPVSASHDLVGELASIELEDTHGGWHRLDSYWRDHTAVLAFVRHFG